MVVWERVSADIMGRRYSSSGAPLGSEFTVASAHNLGWQNTSPSVGSDSAGGSLVVWSGGPGSFPPVQWDVYGRRFDNSGPPSYGEFRVNSFTTGTQDEAVVSVDAGGNFVIVWKSAGQDGHADGIFGQRYLVTGDPLGLEFRANTYTTQGQSGPAVAADPAGNFIVVWTSDTQDGSGAGVFGQRYSMIVPVELMQFGVD